MQHIEIGVSFDQSDVENIATDAGISEAAVLDAADGSEHLLREAAYYAALDQLRIVLMGEPEAKPPAPTRYALVRATAGSEDQLRAYLPDNYVIVGRTAIGGSNTVQYLITGRDVMGWTLDGYVLPRLASGMYYGEEIA